MRLRLHSSTKIENAPPELRTEIQQMFTVRNPLYEEATKRGRYALNIPQHLRYHESTPTCITFPRGAAQEVLDMARQHGPVEIIDQRLSLPPMDLTFNGNLRPYQLQAVDSAMRSDSGVLEAGTGSGKTVMGLAVIAARRQPTLILCHTKELLHQWRDRIGQFLGVEAGLIGDGKFDVQPLTVGIVNSVRNRLESLVDQFGHIVADECHRCPSTMFTAALAAFPAKYRLGLSATPFRRDQLTALIGWYCGQHRVTVDRSTLHQVGAVLRPEIISRPTEFHYPFNEDYSTMISALVNDPPRNHLIAGDIRNQAAQGGLTLVVSDRTAHLQTLAAMADVDGSRILTGKTPAKQRKAIVQQLADGEVRVLYSTLSLIGEGFDCPSMDSLFYNHAHQVQRAANPGRWSGSPPIRR